MGDNEQLRCEDCERLWSAKEHTPGEWCPVCGEGAALRVPPVEDVCARCDRAPGNRGPASVVLMTDAGQVRCCWGCALSAGAAEQTAGRSVALVSDSGKTWRPM